MNENSFFRRLCQSSISSRAAVSLAALAAMVLCPTGKSAGADTKLVEQKIQALGLRDDTLSYEQQPYNWLWERREQLVAPLVAGLQSTDLESARQCLRILIHCHPVE